MKEDKPQLTDDPELIRKIYIELKATDQYQQYINVRSRDKKDEKDILEFILNDLMLPNENFTSFIEEKFPNWDDDADMVQPTDHQFAFKTGSFQFPGNHQPRKMGVCKRTAENHDGKKGSDHGLHQTQIKNWDPDGSPCWT